MTEPNLVTGSYIVKSEHTLTQSPLEMAVAGMEGAATRFSIDAIKDERVRASYQRNIKRMSEQIFADVRAGNISVEEGTKFSNEMRNKIMFEHRKFTSAHGLAIVQKRKNPAKPTQIFLTKSRKLNSAKTTNNFQRRSRKKFCTKH
jgi:hypothetical protein